MREISVRERDKHAREGYARERERAKHERELSTRAS